MSTTKTYTIGAEASLSGSVGVSPTMTWTGNLESGRVAGKLKCNYGPGLCDLHGAVKVNGTEVGTFNMAAVSEGYAEGTFSFDVTPLLMQGANDLTFFLWCSWGWAPFFWIRIDGTITITGTDVIIHNGGTDCGGCPTWWCDCPWKTWALPSWWWIAAVAAVGVVLYARSGGTVVIETGGKRRKRRS